MEGTVSILVTAYNEPSTVGQALRALLPQVPSGGEIVVVCPDDETGAVVRAFADSDPVVRLVRDDGRGKPAALNRGLEALHGAIVVFTDGDVLVEGTAVTALLRRFAEEGVGAVTGRPVSVNPRGTMLGYWSHLLTDAGAHLIREKRDAAGDFLVCSGYLYAARRCLVHAVPEDALAEDAVISHQVAGIGYRIRYAPDAIVRVRYPSTYEDWLSQKVRSSGGYVQSYVRGSPLRMRSAWLEVVQGTGVALRYARGLRELVWTLLLFAARLHLWFLVFLRVRLQRRPLETLWRRVETTK